MSGTSEVSPMFSVLNYLVIAIGLYYFLPGVCLVDLFHLFSIAAHRDPPNVVHVGEVKEALSASAWNVGIGVALFWVSNLLETSWTNAREIEARRRRWEREDEIESREGLRAAMEAMYGKHADEARRLIREGRAAEIRQEWIRQEWTKRDE